MTPTRKKELREMWLVRDFAEIVDECLDEIDRLEAENASLKKVCFANQNAALEMGQERDRLREALQRIYVGLCPNDNPAMLDRGEMQPIAAAALEGK